ncbi:hypothetical protein GCG54_00012297 [Colletotrichum gloeosporioides]|uniref:SRR1-like domain-containing protein n=1 Tax=Colletotrichum gloeosporioides TaxID=474922 RepID=A0A8H4FH07_COLGL|nr:uncharacterized protein GCG54_00012297 [Colletotrichum gloeosporioides]KAF3802053.1 hypothetical protein GCG54_00012297 [Colletotrichum gloeosporioides]
MASAATTETKSEPAQEEWTFVKSKSRFRRKPPKVPAKALEAAKSNEPRIFKSVDEITAEYEGFKARWRDTTCHERIKDLVRKNAGEGRRVKKAVCLGVGTFDPEDGGWDAKRRSYIQLDGFLTVVEALSAIYNETIPCSFQEPRFTPNDTKFLENLDHEVVESPAAFEAVDEDTLVFAIHMYRPIYEATLEKALPAMFVGTGWDVWDGYVFHWMKVINTDTHRAGTLKDGEFKCMSDMHNSHKQFAFPQDGTYTSFSSTCLYWRPKPELSVEEDGASEAPEKPEEKSGDKKDKTVDGEDTEPSS